MGQLRIQGGALVVALVIYGRDRNHRDQRQAENVFLTKYLINGLDEKTWSFGKVVVTGYNASGQFIRLPGSWQRDQRQ